MDFIVHLDGPNKYLIPQLWDKVPVELQRMYVRKLLALDTLISHDQIDGYERWIRSALSGGMVLSDAEMSVVVGAWVNGWFGDMPITVSMSDLRRYLVNLDVSTWVGGDDGFDTPPKDQLQILIGTYVSRARKADEFDENDEGDQRILAMADKAKLL